MIAAALLAFLAIVPAQDTSTAAIRGVVIEEYAGRPLSNAIVELHRPDRALRTITDAHGRYRFADIPAGAWTVRVFRAEYAPRELGVDLSPGVVLPLTVELMRKPVAIQGIRVAVESGRTGSDSVRAPAPGVAMSTSRVTVAAPTVSAVGLGGNGQSSGRPQPVDPSDVLYVRGSAADLKLVLLDGAPVYTPFHLAGLMAPIDPGIVGGSELHYGGAPTRYDGGLAYIMDLRTRAGRRDDVHAAGSIGLLDAAATLEGPLPGRDAGFLVSTRTLHPYGLAAAWDGPFPYAYDDAVLRLDAQPGDETYLRATGFWNREALRLRPDGDGDERRAAWGNTAGSIRLSTDVGDYDSNTTAGFGRFTVRVPRSGSPLGWAHGSASRFRLQTDFSRPVGDGRLAYGATYERLVFARLAGPGGLAEEPGDLLADSASGQVVGGYADARWLLAPRVQLRGGLRADIFSTDLLPRLAPRLALTWLVTDQVAIRLAGGRYHQLAWQPATADDDPDRVWPHLASLGLARASHVVAGLEQKVTDVVGLGVEGYFKRFGRVSDATDERTHASGIELWLQGERGDFRGWAGYSLEWVWAISPDTTVADQFTGRQLLSVGVEGPLTAGGGFSLRVGYGAGLPYASLLPEGGGAPTPLTDRSPEARTAQPQAKTLGTSLPIATPPEGPYLRVDAEVSFAWTTSGSRPWSIGPYLKVLNALDRRDSLFYYLSDGLVSAEPVAPLPVLPVVGVRWEF